MKKKKLLQDNFFVTVAVYNSTKSLPATVTAGRMEMHSFTVDGARHCVDCIYCKLLTAAKKWS